MCVLLAGADSVNPDVLESVSEQERKRQEAIFELITSERNYVDSLRLVKEVSAGTILNYDVVGFKYSTQCSILETNMVLLPHSDIIRCSLTQWL